MTDRSDCPGEKHGEYWHYDRWGCRCPDARDAALIRRRRIRKGVHQPMSIDATGTRRRLQALAAMGWPAETLAAEIGISVRTIRNIYGDAPTVRRTVAAAVRSGYDRLGLREGPGRLCRTRARNRGWVTALAWDDDTIDDPGARPQLGDPEHAGGVDESAVLLAVCGEPHVLTRRVDRRAAVAYLARQGLPAAEIGHRLRMSAASVEQIKHRYNLIRPKQGVAA